MTVRTFETGQDVSASAVFRDEAGVLVNPATVTLTVYRPDSTSLAVTPTNPTTGYYIGTFTLSARGTWALRWAATSPGVTYDEIIVASWSSAATGADDLLVTLQEYRDITQDLTSDNERVIAQLNRATRLACEYLQRELTQAEYTETLEVWYEDGIGYVYPLVTPIMSVQASAAYEVDFGERRLRGVISNAPSGVTWPVMRPNVSETSAIPPWTKSRPDYATVTYVGGFTNATLPQTLKEYIAYLASALIRRNSTAIIGMQEAQVGDVRVKYPKIDSALDALVPGVTLGLKPYKRKRVRF